MENIDKVVGYLTSAIWNLVRETQHSGIFFEHRTKFARRQNNHELEPLIFKQ